MTLVIREIVDLSLPIKSLDSQGMFPGLPQPLRTTFSSLNEGPLTYVWVLVDHTGTHLDAAAHFCEGGSTVDQLPISRCTGPGVVLDFSNRPPRYSIEKKDIVRAIDDSGKTGKIGSGWVLLFYTGYTSKAKTAEWLNHPELSEEACRFILETGVSAIGFDAPSPDHTPFPAHRILLPKGIVNYENLANLDKLLNRDFIFVGVPLNLLGSTGSPIRAIAMILENTDRQQQKERST
ncbi:MAG TPA: cyclase family protein [Candidatus Bathyarchaeia archaeon]|nr:cyclase family protein [Candidatus Bathyarchaeia archaeon]